MTVQFVLLAIGAYLLGAVPAAYLAVKWSRGIDIRKVGTSKVGASNVLNAGPKWLVVPVALFDITKGATPVFVAQLIGLDVIYQMIVGLLAIVGHNWPVYLGFKSGGRGVLASLGVIVMFSWKLGLIVLVIAYSLVFIRQVALGVAIALVSLPFLSWFLAEPLDVAEKLTVTCGFITLTFMALMKRVVASRSEFSQDMPLGKVILNRLLFDRDIADRRLWMARAPQINDKN